MSKRLLANAIVLLLLVAAGGALYYRWGLQPADPTGQTRLIFVPQGEGIWAIASVLRQERIIRSAPVFYVAYRFYMRGGEAGKLPASYFDLSPAASVPTIIHTRLRQPAVRRITFPEGFTLEQMADRLAASDLLISRQAFMEAARTDTVKDLISFSFKTESLEGYLFPDTYEFAVGASAHEVLSAMVTNFELKVVESHQAQIANSPYSLHELVTIASLIEREAKLDQDRRLIASVIYNRLRRGMRLQIDATVQYALPERKARLLHSDLRVKSPYNTYLHAGLPPGPICNPGLACLKAALDPAQSDHLYYVVGADGAHIFSKTYAEHLLAIGKARRTRR